MHARIGMYVYICMYVCMYVYDAADFETGHTIHTNTNSIHVHMYICMRIYIYIYIYIQGTCMHTETNMHTHYSRCMQYICVFPQDFFPGYIRI
jgi:hypothetical protein